MTESKKIFVTHRKPHLDEVVAAWLMRTFDPDMQDCAFEFITNTPTGGEVPAGDQYVPVGVGRGKYDEHGRHVGHSASQLVFQDLLHRGLIPNDQFEDKAVEWLVDYAHKEDTAQWATDDPDVYSFALPAILRGLWLIHKDDQVVMETGLQVMGGLVAQLNERAKFLKDWEDRIEFETEWGKAVGVHSTYRLADRFAYHHGFALRVQTDPTKPYGDFRANPRSEVDLSNIYEQMNKLEPGQWYLHQSKKILLANSDTAGEGRGTKYQLNELIDFVRK